MLSGKLVRPFRSRSRYRDLRLKLCMLGYYAIANPVTAVGAKPS